VGPIDVFGVRAGVDRELVKGHPAARVATEDLIDVTGLPFERKRRVAVVLEILSLPRLGEDSHCPLVAAVPALNRETRSVHSAIIDDSCSADLEKGACVVESQSRSARVEFGLIPIA